MSDQEPWHGARLLLVDDDRIGMAMLAGILGNLGVATVMATTEEEALARLADAGPFDGLLLDYHIPGTSGAQIAAKVRATPGLEALPIVTMTGSVDPRDFDAARAAGANEVIHKPVVLRNLLPALRRWVRADVGRGCAGGGASAG
jgi:CheY-like chemotaxis protein